MSKQASKTRASKSAPAPVVADAPAPVAATPAPAPAPVAATPRRLPYPQAKTANKANVLVEDPQKAVAANVVLTAKGTNPAKARVYGYDNFAEGAGGVPKQAKVALVPTNGTPKGVATEQWDKLVALVQANPTWTVAMLYDNKVTSRTVRRSYRAGAIRFVK